MNNPCLSHARTSCNEEEFIASLPDRAPPGALMPGGMEREVIVIDDWLGGEVRALMAVRPDCRVRISAMKCRSGNLRAGDELEDAVARRLSHIRYICTVSAENRCLHALRARLNYRDCAASRIFRPSAAT
jgi:hypothetical protein